MEPPYNAGELLHWRPPQQDVAPVAFTDETFDELAEKLLAIVRQVDSRHPQFNAGLWAMTYGRARTLGRLLVGGELIPLVVGRQ